MTASLTTWGNELTKAVETESLLFSLTDRWWLGPSSLRARPEARPFEREGRKHALRCFVSCPFSSPFADVIHTCQEVCADFGIFAETAGEIDTQDILRKICIIPGTVKTITIMLTDRAGKG